MQKGIKSRLIIHEILKLIKIKSFDFDKAFIISINGIDLIESDIKLIQNVVLSSLRFHLYINNIIDKLTNKIKKNSNEYFLLLSAITQIIFLDFKDFAVVNSTVELSKLKKSKASKNFINAVLRNVIRNKKELKKTKISFKQFPNWFLKKTYWLNKKEKSDFIKTIVYQPQVHLVFKNSKKIPNDLEGQITSKNSIALNKNKNISKVTNYKKGDWWVQDFSAMLPIHSINNFKNKKIADLCSAPGGKTFQLIDKEGDVTSYEKKQDRAEILKQNLSRLGFKSKIVVKDSLKIDNSLKFDAIIIDAPCSSVGTIRRNPDIFFRDQEPNFKNTIELQYNLLKKSEKIFKNNGMLIYIVCSFLKEEGERQINRFLKDYKNFKLSKIFNKDLIDQEIFNKKNNFFYTLPTKTKKGVLIDGFFSASLIKNDK